MKKFFGFLLVILFIASCATQESKGGLNSGTPAIDTIVVGTYTNKGSEGIYLLQFNRDDGSLYNPRLVAKATNPSFMAWSSDREILYSVNEIESGGVSAFQWQDQDSVFALMNHVSSEGASPCHVSVSSTGGVLSSSNYSTGNVVFYPINESGTIGNSFRVKQNTGKLGPHDRQKSPHAHCGMFGKDDRFLYVVDLGLDEIKAYPIDEEGNPGEALTAIRMDPGDGPRHLIFHPDKNQAFVVNELSSTVVSMSVDPETGLFQKIDKKGTLPPEFTGRNQCADIHLSRDGRFLYASNRGHNSIAVFSVSEGGILTFLEAEPTQGEWPRNFALAQNGKFLLAANQNSDNITVFSIDSESGLLDYTGNQAEVFSPVCILFK